MSQRRNDHRMTPDDRYDLAMAGDAASRRNRPSHLVVMAGLVFIASSAVLGFSSCRASKAAEDVDSRVTELETVAGLLAELRAIEQAADPEAEAVYEPYTEFRSTMEDIARDVGLKERLALPRTTNNTDFPGVVGKSYPYSGIEDSDLGTLLDFVSTATERIPGTRVESIKVRPKARTWEMDVTFQRWERLP